MSSSQDRDAIARRFGENLVRCRKRVHLSQEQVSVRAGLHRTEIGMLERGIRVPQIDTLIKLMSAVEASVEDMLDGIEWRPGITTQGKFRDARADDQED